MNASKYENANLFPPSILTLTNKPITEITRPTPVRRAGTLRHLDKSSGGSLAGFALILLFQIPAFILRNVINRAQMSQLHRAHISDDGPAVFRRHVRAVSAHGVAAMRNHVKNF